MTIQDIEKMLINGNLEYQYKIQNNLDQFKAEERIPKYPVLILTCMDPRIDVHRIFQLKPGDVFILRNAGNICTTDVMRSLLITISEFNIKYVVILGHLDCGMTKIQLHELGNNLGVKTSIQGLRKYFKPFIDELINLSDQIKALKSDRGFPSDIEITGMLYDVKTGYIFENQILEKYPNMKYFQKAYQDIIHGKKHLQFNEYLKSMNDNSNFSRDSDDELCTQDLMNNKEISNHNADSNLMNQSSKTEFIMDFQRYVPKINIPKIIFPKIKISIPNIYKKRDPK